MHGIFMNESSVEFRTYKTLLKQEQVKICKEIIRYVPVESAICMFSELTPDEVYMVYSGKQVGVLSIETIKSIILNNTPDSCTKVVLFGSYAKGTATITSDVDLIIYFDGEMNPFKLGSVYNKLSDSLCKPIDLCYVFKGKESDFIKNIEEGILIYEK